MNCCATVNGLDKMFGLKRARRELQRYWKKGLDRHAKVLIESLKARGIAGTDVLEIGFGIGALHLELLKAGATRAVGLELSPAYVEVAKELAEKLGFKHAVDYCLHNIAEDPGQVAEAGVVVMHRVVCCYPDMAGLVRPAAKRARRFLALSFPRTVWWVRLGVKMVNALLALARRDFRTYLHAPQAINATVEEAGLKEVFQAYSGPWQIVLFERQRAKALA